MASKQYGLKRSEYILDFYIEAGYIVHRISAESGQSGSAVIRTDSKGNMSIVGIHIGSTEECVEKYKIDHPYLDKVNLVKVFNKAMIKKLAGYAQKLKG